jgi:RimJ/RimL family protein N-acetyltransferase
MEVADLPELMALQERGAVAGLSNVFPQDEYPFPRDAVRDRWQEELQDPAISAYVATGPDGRLVGFAARREDEILHFGTALETWGSGLAGWMYHALLATYPPDLPRVRLYVFAGNHRARRFYEKRGWTATGAERHTTFPPHPTLLEYVLDRPKSRSPRG